MKQRKKQRKNRSMETAKGNIIEELSQYPALATSCEGYELTENDLAALCEMTGDKNAAAIASGFRLGFVRGYKAAESKGASWEIEE